MISASGQLNQDLANPLDPFVPAPLVSEAHQLRIPQPPAAAWEALHSMSGDGQPLRALRDEAWGGVVTAGADRGPPARSRASRFCDLSELQKEALDGG